VPHPLQKRSNCWDYRPWRKIRPRKGCEVLCCACLPVCLSVHSAQSRKPHSQMSYLCIMLPVAVARSSSGGIAVCYVLQGWWMTSYFHICALWGFMCIPNWQENCVTSETTAFFIIKFCKLVNDKVLQQVLIGYCASGAKSAI